MPFYVQIIKNFGNDPGDILISKLDQTDREFSSRIKLTSKPFETSREAFSWMIQVYPHLPKNFQEKFDKYFKSYHVNDYDGCLDFLNV